MNVELQKRREEHLSFVIHDLRTPLQAVSLATTMLERSLPDASKTELFAPLLSSSTNVNGYTSVILLAQLNNSLPHLGVLRRHFFLEFPACRRGLCLSPAWHLMLAQCVLPSW